MPVDRMACHSKQSVQQDALRVCICHIYSPLPDNVYMVGVGGGGLGVWVGARLCEFSEFRVL